MRNHIGRPKMKATIWSVKMSTDDRASIPGIVKNGVIVPQTENELPEGAHVEIMLEPHAASTQLREEMAAWDNASQEAWAMIDKWESEEE
jgi:hypothetical protein